MWLILSLFSLRRDETEHLHYILACTHLAKVHDKIVMVFFTHRDAGGRIKELHIFLVAGIIKRHIPCSIWILLGHPPSPSRLRGQQELIQLIICFISCHMVNPNPKKCSLEFSLIVLHIHGNRQRCVMLHSLRIQNRLNQGTSPNQGDFLPTCNVSCGNPCPPKPEIEHV